jgi:hypothetical protein
MISQSTFQRAESPEFTAQIERTVSGVWRAAVTYKRGSNAGDTEIFEFSDETKMREFLGSLSSRVKYFFSRQMPADINAGQRPQRQAQQEQRPEPQKSALEQIGFSREEAEAVIWACYDAAKNLREWYLDNRQNRETLLAYMEDVGLPLTAENFGKAIDEMHARSHLVRKSRKRGEPMVTDYIPRNQNVPVVRDDSAAKNMTLDELKNIERRRQAEAMRKRNSPPDFIL